MKQLKKDKKTLIYAVVGLVFVLLIGKLFFSALWVKINNLNQQIRAQEKLLVANMDLQKRKEKILSEWAACSRYLDATDNISGTETVTKFLGEVEAIAKDSGISIVSLNPQSQPELGKGYKKYSADLRAEASVEQVLNFLSKVQNSRLLIKMEKMSLAPKDEQGAVLKFDAAISITIP